MCLVLGVFNFDYIEIIWSKNMCLVLGFFVSITCQLKGKNNCLVLGFVISITFQLNGKKIFSFGVF